uniref:Uncharacterized protein n=1 Tax=Tanacetum cinerariifolium TaxID=118510 RepID=A0A699L9Y9_TANCI|nr:hypothetical protein [Tanacetum cinerariifolium]
MTYGKSQTPIDSMCLTLGSSAGGFLPSLRLNNHYRSSSPHNWSGFGTESIWLKYLVVAVPPAVTNNETAPPLHVPKKNPPVPVKQLVKPPHPDTKYLSKILSVLKPDQLCSDDDLE